MKKTNFITLKQAIDGYIENSAIKNKLDETKLKDEWNKLVGKHISEGILYLQLKDKKLIVKTSSSVIRQELVFMRTRLISSINRKFGDDFISDIHFL